MKFDLEQYAGRRIEIELEGQKVRGRVVRGAGRQPVLLEERGPVGGQKSDTHERLRMLRTWKRRDLTDAELIGLVDRTEKPAQPKRQRSSEWSETVALAEADPTLPPSDWEKGLLAWSEVVHAARRKVERSRKAMMQALREAAS